MFIFTTILNNTLMNYKLYSSFILCLASTALIVLLILYCYVNPIGVHEWDWITNLGGQHEKLSLIEEQYYYYNNVMGRYSSTFISSCTDLWFTHITFKLHFILVFVSLITVLFIIFKRLFFSESKLTFSILSFFIIAWIGGLSDLFDTLFMMTSVHTYLLGFIFFLVFLLLVDILKNQKSFLYEFFLYLIAIIAIGFNEISAFFVVVSLIIMTTNKNIEKETKLKLYRLILVALSSLLFSFLAPGNFSRFEAQSNKLNIFKLVSLSLGAISYNLTLWFTKGNLLLIYILTFNFIPKIKIDKENILFNLFTLKSILIFLVLGHFIIIFASKGTSFPERVVDLIYIYILFFSFGYIFYNINKFRNKFVLPNFAILGLILILTINFFFGGINLNRSHENNLNAFERINVPSNIGSCIKSLILKEPQEYNKWYFESITSLSTCVDTICCIQKPKSKPKSIYNEFHDRKSRKNGEEFMGYFFNKKIQKVKYCEK